MGWSRVEKAKRGEREEVGQVGEIFDLFSGLKLDNIIKYDVYT